MFNFQNEPFNFLPLNGGDLKDLTDFYLISLLQRLDTDYHSLINAAEVLTGKLPEADFKLLKSTFFIADRFIDTYSKLYKCLKNSNLNSEWNEVIEHSLNQELIGIRDTSQHFDERLKNAHINMDFFLKISYKGTFVTWSAEIKNGIKGDASHNITSPEIFDKSMLFYCSYKGRRENNNVDLVEISIEKVWGLIIKVYLKMEDSLKKTIHQRELCCPPISGIFIVQNIQSSMSVTITSPLGN